MGSVERKTTKQAPPQPNNHTNLQIRAAAVKRAEQGGLHTTYVRQGTVLEKKPTFTLSGSGRREEMPLMGSQEPEHASVHHETTK